MHNLEFTNKNLIKAVVYIRLKFLFITYKNLKYLIRMKEIEEFN